MGRLSVGEVVLISFPFSDLTLHKLRPCLIIALAEFDDVIVCQITSKPYSSKIAIPFSKADFKSGSIVINSYIRPDKIATLDQKIVAKALGILKNKKIKEVKISLKKILEIN